MKKILMGALLLFGSLSMSMYIAACSSDGDGGTAGTSSSYSGPGSKWDVDLNDDGSGNGTGTFTITRADDADSAVNLTVTGDYETTASGFLKLTVGTSSDTTNGPTAGDLAYALEVDGFAFLLKPLDSDSEIIPMVVAGTCPTTSTNFNWVVTSHQAAGQGSTLEDNRDLLGIATFNGSDTMTVGTQYDLEGDTLANPSNDLTGTCENGVIALTESSGPVTIWLSSAGAGLVQIVDQNSTPSDPSDDRESVIVAMPQAAIASAAALDGNYIGLVFNQNTGSGDAVTPIYTTLDSSGTNTVGPFTDVDAGTQDTTNTLTLSGISINTPSDGFFRATLTDNVSGDSAPMSCQVIIDAGADNKNVIFCVGTDPDSSTNGAADQLYSVIIVEQ